MMIGGMIYRYLFVLHTAVFYDDEGQSSSYEYNIYEYGITGVILSILYEYGT